ncbi:MAG: hypothetical protein DBX45_01490 [Oscillospiraceae bacterium]|nr:MAG: hypothetical protein DBX45_01490 [Oscillospiraceae bacterium]
MVAEESLVLVFPLVIAKTMRLEVALVQIMVDSETIQMATTSIALEVRILSETITMPSVITIQVDLGITMEVLETTVDLAIMEVVSGITMQVDLATTMEFSETIIIMEDLVIIMGASGTTVDLAIITAVLVIIMEDSGTIIVASETTMVTKVSSEGIAIMEVDLDSMPTNQTTSGLVIIVEPIQGMEWVLELMQITELILGLVLEITMETNLVVLDLVLEITILEILGSALEITI